MATKNTHYQLAHRWAKKNIKKSDHCTKCGKQTKTQYANVSGEYKREVDDWRQLCALCHRHFDMRDEDGKRDPFIPFLLDMRDRLMIELHEKGYDGTHIAIVFNRSRQLVSHIIKKRTK